MSLKRLVIVFIFLGAVSFGRDYGSISGTVLDERGAPVADATVYAHPLGVMVMGTAIPEVSTTSNGRYEFKRLSYGRYQVTPAKPEDDYPPLYLNFYAGFVKQPEVELSDAHRDVTLDLKLEKKAGVLVGTVSDADTGSPLDANVDFHCPEDPRRDLGGSGLTNARFRVLVPTDTPVMMKVSQMGYEDWWYTRDGVVAPIRLNPGETLELEIKLRRVDAKPPQSR
jgi:hypothetical protein